MSYPLETLRDVAFPGMGPLGLGSPPSSVRCDATTAIWPSQDPSLGRSLPDTLRAPLVRGVPAGLMVSAKRRDHARAFGHPVPHVRDGRHGDRWLSQVPEFPL